MSTARDLINDSLREIGVLASGESPSADEQSDCLRTFNRMLDSWSTEDLLIYAKTLESFSLVANQQAYTMGSGGDFSTARPLKIENVTLDIADSPVLETPVEVINQEQWAMIPLKSTASTMPYRVWPQMAYPLVTLNFWPIPSQVKTVNIYSWKALSQLATASTAVSLPPGYEQAVVKNLAVQLAPQFGKSASAELAMEASEAKANIKRMNVRDQILFVDQALLPMKRPYNIYRGGY